HEQTTVQLSGFLQNDLRWASAALDMMLRGSHAVKIKKLDGTVRDLRRLHGVVRMNGNDMYRGSRIQASRQKGLYRPSGLYTAVIGNQYAFARFDRLGTDDHGPRRAAQHMIQRLI